MPPQEDFYGDAKGEGVTLDLLEVSLQEGQVRRKHLMPDEIQRLVITDRSPTSQYKVKVLLAACIHGHLTPDKTKPASLILVDYEFNVVKEGAVFSSVMTSFTFSEYEPSPDAEGEAAVPPGQKAAPRVVAFAPFVEPVRSHETTGSESTKTTLGVSLKPEFGGVSPANMSMARERQSAHEQKYFDQGMASREFDKHHRPYMVWWWLAQNANQKLGVPPKIRVAMLVERDGYNKFQAAFSVAPRGGIGYKLEEMKERWIRRTTYDDPIIFDPMNAKPHILAGSDLEEKLKIADKDAVDSGGNNTAPKADPAAPPGSHAGAPGANAVGLGPASPKAAAGQDPDSEVTIINKDNLAELRNLERLQQLSYVWGLGPIKENR